MKKLMIIILFIAESSFVFSQNDEIKNYYSLIDSAEFYISVNVNESSRFLNLIPFPLEESIKNNLGKYYYLSAQIEKTKSNLVKSHEKYILSIKYAEEENDLKTAGDAYHELALNLYNLDEIEEADFYIKKAKEHYTTINYEKGLLNVLLVPPYRKYLSYENNECIELTMENIDVYKAFTEDQYYYLFANYMLTSSHIGLDNVDTANKYFSVFSSLKDNPTISKSNYQYFKGNLHIDYVSYFIRQDKTDSALYYLSIVQKNIKKFDDPIIREIYLYFVDVYKITGEKDKENAYLDSLRIFNEKVLSQNIKGTFEVHKSLIESDKKVNSLEKNSNLIKGIAFILILIIISFIIYYYYFFRRKFLSEYNTLKDEMTLISFVDSNHEKLKIKTKSLEEYIIELKKTVQSITQEKNTEEQRKQINRLYKDLHLKTVNSPQIGGSHSELVNKINAKFFLEIKRLHPQLNESEIVVCYYIFIGLKNKEIAIFLNSSLRSIESKRFRISKKINLSKNESIAEYLKVNFNN